MTEQGLTHRVLHVRHLDPRTFVLRFERRNLDFEPGQYVILGTAGSIAKREYTIYSGSGDDFLEVLVREIQGGRVSTALKASAPGDPLCVEGPHGLFVTEAPQRSTSGYLFVASGTGISPFHCLARSYPGIDYHLLHGVRTAEEGYDREVFHPARTVLCVSGGKGGDYPGRVTGYLKGHPVDPGLLCYLCGNSDMIYESFAILRDQGVPRSHLFAEVYF